MTLAAHPSEDQPQLRTARLLLRRWTDADREPFAVMNADPRVMEHFPGLVTRSDSDAFADRIDQHFRDHGFGLWAVEPLPGQAVYGFMGFVGLAVPGFEAPFTPCVEVGWRLRHDAWGHGYATEAAQAALTYGFDVVGLPQVVSFTTVANLRSRAVMERLDMSHDPADDFDHPRLPAGDPIRPHVLYRLPRERWRQRAGAQ